MLISAENCDEFLAKIAVAPYVGAWIETDQDMRLVMAHELGHAILHRRENCYFIRSKTFLSTAKIENEANTFAAELLIPDSLILENPGYTKSQLARLAGYNEMIMEFKKID